MSNQLELPLTAVLAHKIFPGRTMLLVAEIASALRCTDQHVLNLVEEGTVTAIDIATGEPAKPSQLRDQKKSPRRCLRIPVSAYDNFVKTRSNLDL